MLEGIAALLLTDHSGDGPESLSLLLPQLAAPAAAFALGWPRTAVWPRWTAAVRLQAVASALADAVLSMGQLPITMANYSLTDLLFVFGFDLYARRSPWNHGVEYSYQKTS